jgi:hypothetical protein
MRRVDRVQKGGCLIVRQLLSLFAILPMLLPSGMCLCQFECALEPDTLSTCTTEHQVSSSIDQCEHCRGHAIAATVLPPAVGDSSLLHFEQPDSNPAPHEHQSDCPIVTGLSPRLAVVNLMTDVEWLHPAGSLFAIVVGVAGPRHAPAEFGTSSFVATPLFLSHCALLI